jgi:crossover junction endodeoxyribonuclease RuvC
MGRVAFDVLTGQIWPFYRFRFIHAVFMLRRGIILPLGECSCFVLSVQKSNKMQGRTGMARVLGIDPGLRNMGWGVIDVDGPRIRHVANGIVHSEGADLAVRLLSLYRGLTDVIERYAPLTAAVEQTFVNKDGAGTLKLGQARGIAMLVPAQAGLTVGEYAPNKVKKTVVGVGHADKGQVAHMVKLQLPGVELAGPDAADALAIAICHAHHGGASGLAAALEKALV